MAHKYTKEEREFIERNYLGIKSGDLAQMFNAEFGSDLSRNSIKAYLKNHNLHNGVVCRFPKGHIPENKGKKMSAENYAKCAPTMFRKGHIPANKKPIGSERINCKDGYHLVKVAEPNVWRLKHVVLWEKYNGPVPKGHMIVFANQNKDDIRIDNLLLVSKAEICVANRKKLLHPDRELVAAAFCLSKLLVAVSKSKKRQKKQR